MGESRRKLLETFCREHGIEALYSFGSRGEEILHWLDGGALHAALPTGREASDVDIGVKPVPDRGHEVREKALILVRLEDLFSVHRVDLVFLPDADPFLAANVIRGERLYARDGFLADEYELYILRRALEALFDLGRHILAKGFASAVSEYRRNCTGSAPMNWTT